MKKMLITRRRAEQNDNAGSDEKSGFQLPQAKDASNANKDKLCEEFENSSREEQSGSAQRLPRNESRPSETISHEEELKDPFIFRSIQKEEEGKSRNQEQDENDKYSSITELLGNQERRSRIVEALKMGQPERDLALEIRDLAGQYGDEEVNFLVKNLYGIDYNEGFLIFEEIMPGRMFDGNKWRRTVVGFVIAGRLYAFMAREPGRIRLRSHNFDSCQQESISSFCNRDEQLISHPSKEKYGYLPQFHKELCNSTMAGFFGNSEEVEGFLVGGKEKLQEIRWELSSCFRPLSPNKTHEKDIDGPVLTCGRKKLLTLWGVEIYEEDLSEQSEGCGILIN